MQCPQCGKPLPEDSRFCQYCGERLEKAAPVPAQPQLPEERMVEEPVRMDMPETTLEEPAVPAEEPIVPLEEPAAPVEEPADPVEEPADPVEEPATLAEEPVVASAGAVPPPGGIPPVPGAIPLDGGPPEKRPRYCKRCGEPVHPQTKRCQGCGKQYFRLSRHIGTFALAAVCALLVGLNIFQYTRALSTQDRLDRAYDTIATHRQTISDQRETISAQKVKISALEDDVDLYKDLWTEDFDKAMFMDDYIVVVGADDRLYHKYGCEDLDTTSFLAYNSENAKAQGYRACSKCNGVQG